MSTSTIMERAWRQRHPLRTLYHLLDMRWFHHLGFMTVLYLKSLPILIGPLFVAEIVRIISEPAAFSPVYFWTVCVLFFTCLLMNLPMHAWFIKLTSNRTRSLEHRLRSGLVRHLQQLAIGFHNDTESGRLQSKVLRDVDQTVVLTTQLFNNGQGTIIAIIWALTVALYQEPIVALSFVFMAPLCIAVVHRFRDGMRKRNRAFRERVETMASRVSDMIDLIPVTRAHALEDHEIRQVDEHLDEVKDRGHRVDWINGWFQATAAMTMQGSMRIILIIAAYACYTGLLTVDKVILYSGLFAMIVNNLNQLINLMPQISKGFESIESLGEVLESPDIEHNRGRPHIPAVTGRITFEQVTFFYEDSQRPAVERFNLDVQPGECIAVVGESGSGKSTLMNLLIGFWRPSAGHILMDGHRQNDIDLRSWRRHVAVVPQTTVLFSGTLRDNISYGMDRVSEKQIWQAIEAANLESVIADLPEGLDTIIGENGTKLSGGQRQRVAIARAIIRNPKIIILDEATSALDVKSEKEVQEAIDRLIAGRTTFIVAHRLSTIRRANRVVVMKSGRCTECGEQDELVAQGGEFAALKALQA